MKHDSTKAIHTNLHLDKEYKSACQPIYMTSTFGLDPHKSIYEQEYFYSRFQNPTRQALEETLANLENGTKCIATCSGMAAIHLVMYMLKAGDHIITTSHIYGGTYALLKNIMPRFNIEATFLDDLNNIEDVKNNIKENTRLILFETPTNPSLTLIDIEKLSSEIKIINNNILIAVDNTFMTPVLQKPLDLGADIVIHSTTKYINGHSDIIAGAVIIRNKKLAEELTDIHNIIGSASPPFDSWLTMRGLKSLPARMRIHQENTLGLAKWLEAHPKVTKVNYPGLESHPQYNLSQKQAQGAGGVLSFEVDSSVNIPNVLSSTKLYTVAVSLGGVESLISHPWGMTHACMAEEDRYKAGANPQLIRISVGIESLDDLIDDLEQALNN